jgi:hypothetical protein
MRFPTPKQCSALQECHELGICIAKQQLTTKSSKNEEKNMPSENNRV